MSFFSEGSNGSEDSCVVIVAPLHTSHVSLLLLLFVQRGDSGSASAQRTPLAALHYRCCQGWNLEREREREGEREKEKLSLIPRSFLVFDPEWKVDKGLRTRLNTVQ